jgi:hypothetical protein
MSVLHHMIVMLTADTKGFQKDLSSAGTATKGLQGEVKTAAATNKTMFDSLKTAAIGLGVFAAAGTAVKKVVVESINETVEYNKQIREMTQVTGLSADETSRLIQVADDWGVSISDVRTAMERAMKNGFSPTIENLATLADEYVNTKDKTEFAAKATETFGRQWTTLVPLLSQGGDALREQAAAVDDSLIATEEAIAASREYEVAMDGLGDASLGLKYKIGNELIPVMTSFVNLTNDMINLDAATWFEDGADAAAKFINKMIYGKDTVFDFEVGMERFRKEDELTITAVDDLAGAIDGLTATEDPFITVMGLAEDALSDFNVGQATQLDLIEKIKLATGELTDKDVLLKDAINFLTRMLADGKLTQEEYLALVQQLAEDGALAAEIVKGLGNAVLLLPDSKDIHINVRYHKYGQEDPDAPVKYPEEDYVPGPGLDSISLGGQVSQRGLGSSQSTINNFNYSLTIQEAGQRGNVVMDFALLQALSRG